MTELMAEVVKLFGSTVLSISKQKGTQISGFGLLIISVVLIIALLKAPAIFVGGMGIAGLKSGIGAVIRKVGSGSL